MNQSAPTELSPAQYDKIWSELLNNPELERTRFKISVHELRLIVNTIVNAIGSVDTDMRNHSPRKLSELIRYLVQIEREHGDLEIVGPTDNYMVDFIPIDEDDCTVKHSDKPAVRLLIE